MSEAIGLIEALRRRADEVAGRDWETAGLLAEAADELEAWRAARTTGAPHLPDGRLPGVRGLLVIRFFRFAILNTNPCVG